MHFDPPWTRAVQSSPLLGFISPPGTASRTKTSQSRAGVRLAPRLCRRRTSLRLTTGGGLCPTSDRTLSPVTIHDWAGRRSSGASPPSIGKLPHMHERFRPPWRGTTRRLLGPTDPRDDIRYHQEASADSGGIAFSQDSSLSRFISRRRRSCSSSPGMYYNIPSPRRRNRIHRHLLCRL